MKERLKPNEVVTTVNMFERELNDSMRCVREIGLFGEGDGDEFTVRRENGEIQGIFKSWAVPVIPFLESNREDLLLALFGGENIDQSKINEGRELMSTWADRMNREPIALATCLEKWRMKTEIIDRRLSRIFSEMNLPNDRDAKIAELVLRLKIAFAASAPFYHLEAMVGGGGESWHNPIGRNGENGGGGELDLVGMALPSALGDLVISKNLDWNGLSWKRVEELVSSSKDNDALRCALLISRIIGVSIEDVVFAANALQFIPVSVGGKKEDMDQKSALKMILTCLGRMGQPSTATAAGRDMNALIRFLNWFPLNRCPENFQGDDWRYAAVCDTSNQLVGELSKGGGFEDEFDLVFTGLLVDQVKKVDATSAKGRFILSLINEGRLRREIGQLIEKRQPQLINQISLRLLQMSCDDAIVDLTTPNPRSIVGGKAAGIREASVLFGTDRVVSGEVISTEFVGGWLGSNETLRQMMVAIKETEQLEEKLILAQLIRGEIMETDLPFWFKDRLHELLDDKSLWAVRSSSFDEDGTNGVTAAGIYESAVGIDVSQIGDGIKKVIASFFSEKAVSFRILHGLPDEILMGVIIQRFEKAIGGVVFTGNNGKSFEAVVGKDPGAIVSASKGSLFDSIKKTDNDISVNLSAKLVNALQLEEIGKLALVAEKIFGTGVDVEFLIKNNKLRVLQLRSLKTVENEDLKTIEELDGVIKDVNIDTVDDKVVLTGPVRLLISDKIDLDQFQGKLFRTLVSNRKNIREIKLSRRIPRTSHFANICLGLNIKLTFLK